MNLINSGPWSERRQGGVYDREVSQISKLALNRVEAAEASGVAGNPSTINESKINGSKNMKHLAVVLLSVWAELAGGLAAHAHSSAGTVCAVAGPI